MGDDHGLLEPLRRRDTERTDERAAQQAQANARDTRQQQGIRRGSVEQVHQQGYAEKPRFSSMPNVLEGLQQLMPDMAISSQQEASTTGEASIERGRAALHRNQQTTSAPDLLQSFSTSLQAVFGSLAGVSFSHQPSTSGPSPSLAARLFLFVCVCICVCMCVSVCVCVCVCMCICHS